jgi:hypothetical protein
MFVKSNARNCSIQDGLKRETLPALADELSAIRCKSRFTGIRK